MILSCIDALDVQVADGDRQIQAPRHRIEAFKHLETCIHDGHLANHERTRTLTTTDESLRLKSTHGFTQCRTRNTELLCKFRFRDQTRTGGHALDERSQINLQTLKWKISHYPSKTGTKLNLVTSTSPLSEIRSSGMTTSASNDNCIFGLLSLHPQSLNPFKMVSAFFATTSAFSLDIRPAIFN